MNNHEKHIFALHCSGLNVGQTLAPGNFFEITDQALWHRITHILRLRANESIILFDGAQEITIELSEQTFTKKNKLSGVVVDAKLSTPISPAITLMPSLLKREAFETVIYLAAQMGATIIQPIIASKTHRSWNGDKELVRLKSIMISACEQAKNFIIPELKSPIQLTMINDQRASIAGIYFEETGQPLLTMAQELRNMNAQNISLVFGPEGGLTTIEQEHLDTHGFKCCALTPTILRAQEAVAVGLGSIRSLLK